MTDLTAIKTPFGLLDRETQEALKAHGGPYQVWSAVMRGSWVSCEAQWREDHTYRVKPPYPDSIDWSHVAPQFKWMARDENGAAWLYTEEPWVNVIGWGMGHDCTRAFAFASYRRGTVDWRDSLVRRPE